MLGMIRPTFQFCLSVSMILLGSAGCRTPGPSAAEFSSVQLGPTGNEAALRAVELALQERGFDVELVDPRGLLVRTTPQSDAVAKEMAGTDLRASATGEARRFVECRIIEAREGLRVYCRSPIQKQVAQAYRMTAESYRSDDTPDITPIERDAATTREQNTVWRTVRRDLRLEREVLEAVERRLGNE